jgi:uncharacterized protein (TIGR04255 family)
MDGDYTGKPRQQHLFQANLTVGAGKAPSSTKLVEGMNRIQLPTADGTRIITVGLNTLAISALRLYRGWEEFRPRIEKAITKYQEVAKPIAVHRIGVRYINKIMVPLPGADPRIYLKCAPHVLEGLPARMNSFMNRNEYSYDDGIKLRLSSASLDVNENSSSFLLDLDVIWESSEQPLSTENVMPRVDDLRDRERSAFESLITEAAREVFDAGN